MPQYAFTSLPSTFHYLLVRARIPSAQLDETVLGRAINTTLPDYAELDLVVS